MYVHGTVREFNFAQEVLFENHTYMYMYTVREKVFPLKIIIIIRNTGQTRPDTKQEKIVTTV